jgi:hypothetical protein
MAKSTSTLKQLSSPASQRKSVGHNLAHTAFKQNGHMQKTNCIRQHRGNEHTILYCLQPTRTLPLEESRHATHNVHSSSGHSTCMCTRLSTARSSFQNTLAPLNSCRSGGWQGGSLSAPKFKRPNVMGSSLFRGRTTLGSCIADPNFGIRNFPGRNA